ncbi:MAG: 16S rRNA (guanine(527)-N(7))-methyltransferase RsmG [Alphaproteobacteria bacterium]|nr:16S rRNA (guanine(527)-N(7))-methyltransferase RsmG [Alphaproteobacteria bacterium]
MWPESLGIGVSPEIQEKLEAFHALLVKWQPTINLVSPTTMADAWNRHFADSAQIAQYIPDQKLRIADMGSGAGFPGLVLAMMRPDLEIHLVESDDRKAQFLRSVSRETNTPVQVHAERLVHVIDEISPQWLLARAVADLRKLLIYVAPYAHQHPEFTALFMKGAQVDAEMAVAKKEFNFKVKSFPSLTDAQARILKITEIKDKKRA